MWNVTLELTNLDATSTWETTFVVEAADERDAVSMAMGRAVMTTVSLSAVRLVSVEAR